ncbi:thioredoxin reductase [Halorubrum coriense DSM 10284]|uniref:Thioredoxin reductase n=1 Tax=Halorubrum coriense DSM 10284 TaxID=1227466 RepID=M0ECC0_9EURY|nr:FAD-dependent oxidoreductase [Halorubrum coriense]ELZ44502.1 thioredoxin reductase [Halorubrum coriense DSM 10284]
MSDAAERDVAVVGCGPAGCAAAVFAARDGLDVAVFDRGRSSLARCAHLENYPGFPAGVDVGTLSDLFRAQAERAGCAVVDDLVESVERAAGDDGGPAGRPEADEPRFVVTPQEGEPVTARRVVAATRYDGEYLRGLDDDEAMFAVRDHGDETHEHFDREYADRDGTTPVDGLYVASPSDADRQAITAAGRGARVGKRVVADARIDDGWWPEAAAGVDWVRREAELDDEWAERDRWVEWFDAEHADGPVDPDSDRFARVREAAVDDARSSYVGADDEAVRAAAGQRALAERLDPDAIVDAHGPDALLDAMDDGAIAAHAAGDGSGPSAGDPASDGGDR